MDYNRIYASLIERAKNRLLEGYVEKHHIIPKCLGGTNEKENLVDLTAEEHFVAHQLLVRIYPKEHKLVYAANMMCIGNERKNNRHYAWLKKRFSEVSRNNKDAHDKTSRSLKGRSYEDLHGIERAEELKNNKRKSYEELHGIEKANELKEIRRKSKLGCIHSDSTKLKISTKGLGRKPWNKGLNITYNGKTTSVLCVETGVIYKSFRAAARAIGGNDTNIGNCAKGKLKSAYGYTWQLV